MFSRRSFIRKLAGAAAALSLPATASASQRNGGGTAEAVERTRLLMGTFVTVKTAGAPEDHALEAMDRAFAAMADLEALLTRFDGSSALGQLNAAGVLRDAPAELLELADASAGIGRLTGGSFDPTVLPVLEGMLSGADESELAERRDLVGMSGVVRTGRTLSFSRSGMAMSLDGIAKGYIADACARSLLASGVGSFLVNAGGDIIAYGAAPGGRPWRIAVEKPGSTNEAAGWSSVRSLRNGALATSGDGEALRLAGTGHIIDPLTGRHAAGVASASVAAPTAMQADALATALCVMPDPMRFIEALPDAACCLVMNDGSVRTSSRWA